jgi:hypothetical protein
MTEINDLVAKLGLAEPEEPESTAKAGDLVWYIDWVDRTRPEIRGPAPLYQDPMYPWLLYKGFKDTRTFVKRDGTEGRMEFERSYKFTGFDNLSYRQPDFSSYAKAKEWLLNFLEQQFVSLNQAQHDLREMKTALEKE